MDRTEVIQVRASVAERTLLQKIARVERVRPSEALRILLRQGGRERGLWPPPEDEAGGSREVQRE